MQKFWNRLSFIIIPSIVLLHLYLSPFTKVEESFNIQAVHDILRYGVSSSSLNQYDHVSFPGAVPRTFIGALVLAGVSRMWIRWLSDGRQLQLLVRGILGLANALTLLSVREAVVKSFGPSAGAWYIFLQASQFHVMYYASRTLPNMFAFALSNLALRNLILVKTLPSTPAINFKRARLALYLLSIAAVVFRSEIAIFLSAESLLLLTVRRVSLFRDVVSAAGTGTVLGLLLTLTIDSFFWRNYPLWPEWAGFYYNTILGKSAAWGTSPWYFYFLNSLPRLLLNPLSWSVCIPLAISLHPKRRGLIEVLLPLLGFVAVYSFLSHKEWRFIVYVIPGLTAVAAVGAAWIWTRRSKSLLWRLLSLALIGSTLSSFVASAGLLAVSRLNYPGGEALYRLHRMINVSTNVINVYMDDLSCQTGVTHFYENQWPRSARRTLWAYDKTENETALLDPAFWQRFDYVLAEKPELIIGKWEVVDTVHGFGGVRLTRTNGGEVESIPPETPKPSSPDKQSIYSYLYGVENFARSYFTHGWWPVVDMQPRIRILRKQEIPCP